MVVKAGAREPMRDSFRVADRIYVLESGPDELERQTFFGYWLWWTGRDRTAFGVRGQVFRAKVADYVERNEAEGKRVEVWTNGHELATNVS